MDWREILYWLHEENERCLEDLWRRADTVRRRHVGNDVHLRGLLEISNHCVRRCWYCGLRRPHYGLKRYRMTESEIMDAVDHAMRVGCGTVVMQAGQDDGLREESISHLVRRIKAETRLAVTLSLGERSEADLAAWRQDGADRYLLRFETSNRALYKRIHPSLPGESSDRVAMLPYLRQLGYEVGSGMMVGVPGQTYEDLADDVELLGLLDLDMIGIGPYLPHPATPLAQRCAGLSAPSDRQVPNTEIMTDKVLALARVVCPLANIPSTTALATLNPFDGLEVGLMRGANVVMPNVTPIAYRSLYEIYPSKACVNETADALYERLRKRITATGRTIGTGRGDSPRRLLALQTSGPKG